VNTNTELFGELDKIAYEAGGYVDYCPDPNKKYGLDSSELIKYCQHKGIDSMDLTMRERVMFIVERVKGKKLDPLPDVGVEYDYRGISRYSKEKGIKPLDLTVREMLQFVLA